MHFGQYVFTQMTNFLPKRYFERLVAKSSDRTKNWTPSHWSQLLVLMFGQLIGCKGLRELTDITTAHGKKSFHLGLGRTPINKSTLSKANNFRDSRIFEEFALYMVSLAQKRRITREFELHGRFYAVDSTTIDLCMSLFGWAKFRSTKSGIKLHAQVDIVTEIPVFYRITNANVHDVNIMDRLTTVIFTKKQNKEKYPGKIRRIVYYAPELCRTFTYYTNNFYFEAKNIALLYKYRWQVELFLKWIKQHLKVKSFWGTSENAVRIQIHVAIITYCLIGIIEHDLKLGRPIMQVMRILGSSLLTKDDIMELFIPSEEDNENHNGQLEIKFDFD